VPGGDTQYGPITGAAAGITILGMLVFLISVWREFARKR